MPTIHTGAALTLVYIHLTKGPCESCHADAGELSDPVKASGLIVAGSREALVYVGLTPWARVPAPTLALERTLGVHTFPKVLARVGTNGALIHILVTGTPCEAWGASADGTPIHGVSVTDGIFVARVTDASIIQVAQEPSLAHRTGTIEGSHPVMARGSMEADSCSTVIDVLTTALPRPAIDTDTAMPSVGIKAGAPIVTGIWLQLAFIYIFCAKLACPLWGALAVVRVNTVHTSSSIQASVLRTVVYIHLAVVPFKARQAGAVIRKLSGLVAGAPITALGGGTRG